jgi:hypothetical protein
VQLKAAVEKSALARENLRPMETENADMFTSGKVSHTIVASTTVHGHRKHFDAGEPLLPARNQLAHFLDALECIFLDRGISWRIF